MILTGKAKESFEKWYWNDWLEDGDVVDIHQTVNGCRYFNVIKLDPLDIEYSGLNGLQMSGVKYEYDKTDLLASSSITGEVEWSILDKMYL